MFWRGTQVLGHFCHPRRSHLGVFFWTNISCSVNVPVPYPYLQVKTGYSTLHWSTLFVTKNQMLTVLAIDCYSVALGRGALVMCVEDLFQAIRFGVYVVGV